MCVKSALDGVNTELQVIVRLIYHSNFNARSGAGQPGGSSQS